MKNKIGHTQIEKSLVALPFIIALLFLPAQAFCQSEAGANKYFRNVLSNVREEFKVPALGGVLVIGGKIVVAGATGVRKQGDQISVTDNDKFPIGSITKTFTGFLASRMVQQNKLSWNTSIKDVFPNIGDENGVQNTYLDKVLAEMTTHQAEFPRNGDESTTCDKADFDDYMICGRNEFMKNNMKKTPEPAQDYSNIGPVIVANMAQEKTDKTWEQLVKEHIYDPLGLSAGFISTVDFDNVSDPQFHEETGYLYLVNKHVPYTDGDKYNVAAPAGHVTISPRDMGKYLIELMPGAPGRVGALSEQTLTLHLEQLNANRRVTRGGWIIDANAGESNTNWAPGQRILGHNGSHLKNYSMAKLLPEAKVGFCAMTNSSRHPDKGTSRGVRAVDKLNEHFKVMWYNQNVLTFFDEASSFGVTASSTNSNQKFKTDNLKDTDMLTTWRAGAPNSSLQLNITKPLAQVRSLILIYPRDRHRIKEIKIFAKPGNGPETLIYTDSAVGDDNSIFEFDPILGVNNLRIEFVNKPGLSTEIAEVLLLYDDPLGRIKNKLKGIRAIDKKVVQPPPVFEINKTRVQQKVN